MDALPQLVTPQAVKLMERFKILNEREVHARYEMFLENYNKTINIEGQLMVLMANRYILPAAFEYQKQIGQSVAAVKAGGGKSAQGKKLLGAYTKLVDKLKSETDALAKLLEHSGGSAEKHAKFMRDKVVPAMAKLRETGDSIEVLTPHAHLAAADLPGDAVREVGHGGAGGAGHDGCDGPATGAGPFAFWSDWFTNSCRGFRHSKTRSRARRAA